MNKKKMDFIDENLDANYDEGDYETNENQGDIVTNTYYSEEGEEEVKDDNEDEMFGGKNS